MDKINKFIEWLKEQKFTGQLRLNFHEGNLSEKVEIKESNFFGKLLEQKEKNRGDLITFGLKNLK